jgi:hypothetical protein
MGKEGIQEGISVTGKFQFYVFSYGTEMPAWKEK